jgi:glycosyltransferase involved in cell wall biosynthesis
MFGCSPVTPKITVITINYNMGAELDITVRSVLSQKYSNLEYIVIDGGSTDRSIEVIKRHTDRIAHWVSQRDRGRYDAMNKGVRAASGEWIIFMNAGDYFHDTQVVADIFSAPCEDADLVYGNVLRHYAKEDVQRVIPAQPLSVLPLRMPCSHQSLFARRELLLSHPFSQELSIAADHDFILRTTMAGARFKKVDRIISVFSTGGISDQKRLEALRQIRMVLQRLDLMTPLLQFTYAVMVVRALGGAQLKRILPKQLTAWVLKHKTFD